MVFDIFKSTKDNIQLKAEPITSNDVVERPNLDFDIFKAVIPRFLYKPPFGWPRPDNPPMLKQFARNGYILAVITKLQEAAAWTKWSIKPKEGVEMTPDIENKVAEIKDFLNNPNGNKEGWSHIVKACVRDLCELDSAIWVKVFGRDQKLHQLFARDSGTFLKNPDKFGYIGNREDFVLFDPLVLGEEDKANLDATAFDNTDVNSRFALAYAHKAAYWQYGWENASYPIPFGKREIVYFNKNPRADSIYGMSPVGILADVIMTLVYGSQYNLDFYQNSNMPEGIISMLGASTNDVKSFKDRLSNQQRELDPVTGFQRKVGFRMPVINVDAKFVPFQAPAREMQILEQQAWFSKVVWMAFGLTADDLGFTENSNKAVSESMDKRYAKTAVRPFLEIIAERVNMEILPEFDTEDLEFCFDDYDLDEDIKKHTLMEAQIRMGIKTPEMVAEEEQIDVAKLKQQKEEAEAKEVEKNNSMNQGFEGNDGGFGNNKPKDKKEEKKPDVKAIALGVGINVRCTSNLPGYNGKIGVITEELTDGSFRVKFDNVVITLAREELVVAGNDESGMKLIKDEDFDNTLLEKDMIKDLENISKKVGAALKIYGQGALKDGK